MNNDNIIDINERWKYIDGYDDYIITESGRVFTYRSEDDTRGYKGLREISLKGKNNPKRYLQVCLSKNDVKKYEQVHRLVGNAFVDGYFEGAVINHKDSNIHNNHYLNLEWVTQKDNVRQSYINSGINQVRNYIYWNLYSPEKKLLGTFKGAPNIKKYLIENNLDCAYTSLRKYRYSRGYTIEPVN
jgi:hypothetical protein